MNHLGEKIKRYRNSIKMTQADFADRLDVTGAAVSAYENGTRLPSYDVLVKIANILNVTTDELLGRMKLDKESLDVTELTVEQRKNLSEMAGNLPAVQQNLCGSIRGSAEKSGVLCQSWGYEIEKRQPGPLLFCFKSVRLDLTLFR